MPLCELSSRSFGWCAAFSELMARFFWLWVQRQAQVATPAWAVSQCDRGHDAAAGCAQLLLPSAAERLHLFGARPQGIPESFSLS